MFFRVISGGGLLVGLCWGRVLGLCVLLGLFCGAGLGVGARGVRVLAAAGAGARWRVSMGRRGCRRAVVALWRATSRAGAGSIFLRSARAGRVRAIVAI